MLAEIIDAVVAHLETLSDLDLDSGGFRDQIELPERVWWGNPGILPAQSYPFIYVTPEISQRESETTSTTTRRYNVRIVVLVDPRPLFDVTEIHEMTAGREMVNTMEAIEAHFEKKSLRVPNALAPGVKGFTVQQTEYAEQVRGDLYSLGASVLLEIDAKRSLLD